MKTILLEVRDRDTFLIVMATQMKPYIKITGTTLINTSKETLINTSRDKYNIQNYLLKRIGFDFERPSVIVTNINTGKGSHDPYKQDQSSRTMFEAHKYIERNFIDLVDGDVIDIEYILGETKTMKRSERLDNV